MQQHLQSHKALRKSNSQCGQLSSLACYFLVLFFLSLVDALTEFWSSLVIDITIQGGAPLIEVGS